MAERKGQGFIQTYSGLPVSASIGNTTSSAVDVSDYTYHSVQASFTLLPTTSGSFSGSLKVENSNDGVYWNPVTESQVSTSSLVIPLPIGRQNYLRYKLLFVSLATGSVFQVSGL